MGLSGEVYYNNICREFGVVEVVEGEEGREGGGKERGREREGGSEGGRERGRGEGGREMMLTRERGKEVA